MISIDLYSRTPVYQQIIDGYKRDILLGIVKNGDQIRSVRELSQELGANPNTVQKAYTELDRLGLITSVPGKGSFVADHALQQIKQAMLAGEKENIRQAAERLAQLNVPKEDVIQWIENIYQSTTDKGAPIHD